MRNKSTGGFTLIELLIVIAIIGILAAVLIPNLLNARTRAFNAGAQSCANSMQTAQEIHYIDNDAYASAYGDLDATNLADVCAETNASITSGDADGWAGTVKHNSGDITYDVTHNSLAAQ